MLKGKNLSILLAVLVILVVVFVITRFTGGNNRSASFKAELVEFNTDRVTQVVLMTPSDTTTLVKQGDGWLVNKDHQAKSTTVTSMLNNLKNIKPSRLAARSEEKWKDFQVDDQGTRIQVFEGSDKTLDIVLGRFNVEGQRSYSSYVRLFDDNDTYVAQDFMKMSVNTSDKDYRVDDVLRLPKDSIATIDFNYPDSAFSLNRVNGQWMVGSNPADSAQTIKYLNGLSFVSSKSFTDQSGDVAMLDVAYQLKNGSTIQVVQYGNGVMSSTYNSGEKWEDPQLATKLFKGPGYFTK